VAGEGVNRKINRLIQIMKKKKIDYTFISSGENICWLLNIRGRDLPNSPVANCKMIITKDRKIYFFSNQNKICIIAGPCHLKQNNMQWIWQEKLRKLLQNLILDLYTKPHLIRLIEQA